MKTSILFLALFIGISLSAGGASAASLGDVVINEIAWMGTSTSANDEWLELKNTTSAAIDLSGWTLKTQDEKIKITLKNTIPAGGFYLLERTDDTTVPGVTADTIYTGALSNTGQHLLLMDASGTTVDQGDFTAKWPAGDNSTKQTMEKSAQGNWQTGANPGGTPKTENSSGTAAAEPTLNPSENEPTPKETPSQPSPIPTDPEIQPPAKPTAEIAAAPVSYADGIIINEILPAPEGPDDTDEWIELYNSNNVEVDLSGWKLQDIQGVQTTYVFSKNTNISAHGYLVLTRPTTKITLNNEGDTVNLLQPTDAIAHSATYPKAPTGQSYNITSSGWQWSAAPTPEKENTISKPSSAKSAKGITLSKSAKPANNKSVQTASLASALSEKAMSVSKDNPLWLFLIVLAIIIITAISIVIFKFKNKFHS